jgi:hypothetical protein
VNRKAQTGQLRERTAKKAKYAKKKEDEAALSLRSPWRSSCAWRFHVLFCEFRPKMHEYAAVDSNLAHRRVDAPPATAYAVAGFLRRIHANTNKGCTRNPSR